MYGVNLSGAEFGALSGKHGWNYIYPSAANIQYYADKGVDFIRLPFRWERVQHETFGELDQAELGRIKTFLDNAEASGVTVILDVHNYAAHGGNVLGSAATPISAFQDLWSKLAAELKDFPALMGYGLMNEPVKMADSTVWPTAAQAAIDSIREIDTETAIYVGGAGWGGAHSWQKYNSALILDDPSNNIVYEAHQYFDRDSSGTYKGTYDEEKADPMVGVTRLQPFIAWLEENNLKGFIGEYGVPSDDPRWLEVMDNFLAELAAHDIPSAYWGAGPWWGDYALSIEPKNGVDSAQMDLLEKHIALYEAQQEQLPAETVTEIFGTGDDDTLEGVEGRNLIDGRGGSDLLRGHRSDDRIEGGEGDDRIGGKQGDDIIAGGGGDDRIWGDEGNDVLDGGDGNDTIRAGAGDDVLIGGNGRDKLSGDDGDDLLLGDEGDDQLEGGAGDDRLEGGDGDDKLTGGLGMDELQGGSGKDVLDGGADDDLLYGGADDDILRGGSGNDALFGEDGNDRLGGKQGDDMLHGGAGDDSLWGDEGDDVLYGGDGSDILRGGDGADRFVFLGGETSIDRIEDFDAASGDAIDLSAILSGYDPLAHLIEDFVQITKQGKSSVLMVDADGGGDGFTAIALIAGGADLTDEAALVAQGSLIV